MSLTNKFAHFVSALQNGSPLEATCHEVEGPSTKGKWPSQKNGSRERAIVVREEREGLLAAVGDSGHGFKFAPVLGEIIADAVEKKPNPILQKFRWRPEVRAGSGTDVARSNRKPSSG